MRFFEYSALAAAAIGSAFAAEAPAAYPTGSLTSATTTYYTTLTVLRVETTVTATRNGTTATYESMATETVPVTKVSASATIPGYGNSTTYGTGSLPSATYVPPPSPGAAGKVGVQAFGIAALAGVIGLLVL